MTQVRDYQHLTDSLRSAARRSRSMPHAGDMVILDLAESGNYVAVRPSGTEPKVKFYLFTFVARRATREPGQTKQAMKTSGWRKFEAGFEGVHAERA